jgi:hypothetical protein
MKDKERTKREGERMHLAIAISFVFAFLLFGDLKDMRKYEASMFYIIMVNLFYVVLCADYPIWKYTPHFIESQLITDCLYIFIVMPLTAYFFLKYLPNENNVWIIIFHMLRWAIPYFVIEWIMIKYTLLTYHNGWTLGWSAIFYCFMFSLILLHHFRRLEAYLVSIIFIQFLIMFFKVPIK